MIRPADRFGTVQSGGVSVDLHWLAWPGPAGRPVVLLHGLMDVARMWTGFADEACRFATLYAPDLRGHGHSAHIPPPPGAAPGRQYLAWAFADDLEALVTRLALRDFDLVAYSLGARAAMIYAQQHPRRVHRLALIDMGPEMPRDGARGVRRSTGRATAPAPAAATGNASAPADAAPGYATLAEAREALRGQFPAFPDADLDALILDAYAQRGLDGDDRLVPAFDPALFAITGDLALEEVPSLWDALSAIACPTLVIRGQRSKVLSAEIAARMLERLPDAREAVVPDAGHRLVTRAPEHVHRLLLAFLREAKR